MGLGNLFQAAASDVTVETSFTPPVSFNAADALRGDGASSSGGLSSLLMPIVRPKVVVAGVKYAPYGEPLPLWPLLLALGVLLLARKFTK